MRTTRFWIFVSLIVINSCVNQNEYDYPLLFLGEVTKIDQTGAEFHANIQGISNEGVMEYGFVWSTNGTPDLNSSNIRFAQPVSTGILSLKITNDLISDAVYYVRAFARNSRYTTYSNTVSFRSKGSLPPVIHDFFPDHGSAGTLVTITGENFSGGLINNNIRFGNSLAQVDSASSTKLIVRLDETLDVSGVVNITLQVADHTVSSDKTFRLDGINIIDFIPRILKPCDSLYVKVENFNPDPSANKVRIGEADALIERINDDTLVCFVPYDAQVGDNQISVTSNNKKCTSNDLLKILDPWSIIKESNTFYRSGAVAFAINDKGYVGTGWDINSSIYYIAFNDLYEFDPLTGKLKQCASLPAGQRQEGIGFSIHGKGYVGLGNSGGGPPIYKDIWEYDPVANSWTEKANFPGPDRRNTTCVVVGDLAYVGFGSFENDLKDLWEYNPVSDQWRRVADCPGNGGPYVAFCIDKEAYFLCGNGNQPYILSNEFWKYNPEKNLWTRLSDFPGEVRRFPVSFALGGCGYLGMGAHLGVNQKALKDFWRYYPKEDKWARISDINVKSRYEAKSFVIGDKAYIVAGVDVNEWQYGNHEETIIIYDPN
ncbi:MAG: IPT/TIG domain-containing protein [Mangrovibacterium sp.]